MNLISDYAPTLVKDSVKNTFYQQKSVMILNVAPNNKLFFHRDLNARVWRDNIPEKNVISKEVNGNTMTINSDFWAEC